MRVFAGLVPPQEIQDELAACVAAVPGVGRHLEPMPGPLLFLRLAQFGNVTLADSRSLGSTLGQTAAQHPAMALAFRGGTVLEPLGDDSAWATIDGEVAALGQVAGAVVQVVKRLGFLVDRRLSTTRVRVGRITADTSVDFLQVLLDTLEAHVGPEWTCKHLTLLRALDVKPGEQAQYELMQEFPLRSS